MCLKQVNPLRDLWEGASLGGRELPWTRKERERERKRREKRRKEERGRDVVLLMERCPRLACVMWWIN
jgi:hypothetical protein